MARVSGPMDLGVPGFNYGGIQFDVPIDLPEGGHLQVVVGENPLGQAIPSRQIEKGCMVAIIPANVAAQLRERLNQAAKLVNNPAALAAAANGNGSRILP
jgi:hypothetical protein